MSMLNACLVILATFALPNTLAADQHETAKADGTIVSQQPYTFPAYEDVDFKRYYGQANYYQRKDYRKAAHDLKLKFSRLEYMSDGRAVVAYLYHPAAGTKKLPVIVYNRGSYVHGDIGAALAPHLHKLASAGFVVVAPMYRGSAGAAGHDEMGGADLADLLNVGALLRNLPRADPERVFLYGESRGGMMVLQALRERFPAQAAATFGAFTDLGELLAQPRWQTVAAKIWPDFESRKAEILERRSAVKWADRIDVPLLIMHGANDQSVSPLHALRLAEKLHSLGRPFELVVFAGDNHILSRHREERDSQALAWFRQHMKE